MKGTSMSSPDPSTSRVVVIGAGPAGLTAARELTKVGREPVVVEKGAIVVGLACTANYKGYRFDMGGHRFFTKVDEVKKMWQEVLGGEFLRRPYEGKIATEEPKPFAVKSFLIDKTEVTNEQFARFLSQVVDLAGGGDRAGFVDLAVPGLVRDGDHWRAAPGRERYPVTAATGHGA